MTRRIGLYLNPSPDTDGGFERARWADEQGFDDIWFPDGDGVRDALTFAATLAPVTRRARLCVGVTPVYTRVPAILATSALAINRVIPNRFVLGLGSSTHTMVDAWYGVRFDRPLTRVRETVELVQHILAGGKTQYRGETVRSRGFRLKEPIEGTVPIFLGAMGPRMLELAGEVADGLILNHFTPLDRIPFVLEHLDIGAKRSGRRVEDIELAQRICVWVTDQPERAREFYRTDFSFYGSTEVYQGVISRLGYPEAARRLAAGFRARDRVGIMAAVPDEAVQRMYVWGDRTACHERVRAYYEAGVQTVAVAVQATDPDDYRATCEAFAPAIFDKAGRGAGVPVPP